MSRDSLPPLAPLPRMALARGRLHEVTGPARHALAARAAGAAMAEGPVLWLRPAWATEGLCAQGLAGLMPDPGALVLVRCPKPVDVLWSAEEALRSGAVALVIAELAEAPDLRQVRRLHLAAAEGVARGARQGRAPLALALMTETADSRLAGVESRWALHPLPTGPARWRLDRLLARGLPPQEWEVRDLGGAPAPGTGVAQEEMA